MRGRFALALALPALLWVGTAHSAPRVGTYERVPTGKSHTSTLTVSSLRAEEIEVQLEVTLNRSPNGDGFYTRSGEIDSQFIPRHGNVALFRSPAEEPGACSLVFVFKSPREVAVTQFGECSWFGVGVNATGTYQLVKHARHAR